VASHLTTRLYLYRVCAVPRLRKPSPQTIAVLSALADNRAGWSYGYDLCRSLGLKAGTVYPILVRLAERGFLETAWEHLLPGRPPRHLYRLSTEGAELVAALGRSATPAVRTLVPSPALGKAER
jgi:PadR family transcriptional regulator, regulatory protein PadR